jgi:hypothetical protein
MVSVIQSFDETSVISALGGIVMPNHKCAMKNLVNMLKTLQPGSFLRVVIQRQVKTLVAHRSVVVVKRTEATVCSGIEYDNQKAVIGKRENGERPEENVGLPWGEWVNYPYEIAHRGNRYVRLYLKGVPKVQWFANGEPVTKEEAIKFCGSNAKSKGERPDCMTIKLENVISAVQNQIELA